MKVPRFLLNGDINILKLVSFDIFSLFVFLFFITKCLSCL